MEKQRKIAGFWKQTQIIFWKNMLLYSKNIIGIIFELVAPLLLLSVLILVLVWISKSEFRERISYKKTNVTAFIKYHDYGSGSNKLIYYYPNTNLTTSLIQNVYMQLSTSLFLKGFHGTDVSNPYSLNETERKQIYAFYSFSNNTLNEKDVFSDSIEYTIYRQSEYK